MEAIEAHEVQAARDMLRFIESCPSMFHTTATIAARLEAVGFTELPEGAAWEVEPGGSYYVTRNGSSIIAFRVGARALAARDRFHFQLAASHGDSPAFKIKSAGELAGPAGYRRLNVEAYGGMMDYTWFDRPLGIAGRALVEEGGAVTSRLVHLDRDVAIIPSVAIHLNRDVNGGFAPNRASDLCPLISAGVAGEGDFDSLVANAVGVEAEQVLASDLFLVNRQQARVWGVAEEFISSPRIDDLMCAYTSLEGFLTAANSACVTVYCCFDNEEVGSNTKQGALSTFLPDTLVRLCSALDLDDDEYRRALSRSFMVSCDNAHALHPNSPSLHDEQNSCTLNGGPVIKEAANQHYCSDAFSRAVFVALCRRADVPFQTFANRSDMAGGSTLGNLSNMQASMHAVDMGCPQLAMHSSYETAGTRDVDLAIRAMQAFFDTDIRIDGAHGFELVSA